MSAGLPSKSSTNFTESFWLRDHPLKGFCSTPKDLIPEQVDFIIIGAGLTGLSVVYHLIQSLTDNNRTLSNLDGLKIVVLEARDIGSGATGRNGGHLTPGFHRDLDHLVQRYGIESALHLHEMEFKGVDETLKMVDEIDPDFGRSYIQLQQGGNIQAFLKGEEEMFQQCIRNIKLLESRGVDCSHLKILNKKESAEIFQNDSFIGAVDNNKAYQLVPANICFLIARYLIQYFSKYVYIYSDTPVMEVSRDDTSNYHVKTASRTIQAHHVIHCTNGYISNLVPRLRQYASSSRFPSHKPKVLPVRGQIIASKSLLNEIKWRGYGRTEGYVYGQYRQSDARIILGGMRNKTKHMEMNEYDDSILNSDVSKNLKHELNDLTQNKGETEWEWSGIMGFSSDGLPMIGQTRKNEWVAVGYTGHGMTRCVLCAKQLVDEIVTGTIPSDARVWHISRFEKSSLIYHFQWWWIPMAVSWVAFSLFLVKFKSCK